VVVVQASPLWLGQAQNGGGCGTPGANAGVARSSSGKMGIVDGR
jgi:hypothetical protein